MNSNLSVIAGLGNPEKKHSKTLHNAGFWFVDEIASQNNIEFSKDSKFNLEICQINLLGNDIWLIKPQSYMNNSGGPISAFLNYYRIPTFKMLVAHDEIDLSPDSIKLKIGGGHAGHNGLRDIIRHCDNNFMRVRFGVGHPGNKTEVTNYVLKNASKSLRDAVDQNIENAISILPALISEGIQEAMKKLHTASANSDEDDNKCQ